MQGDGHLPSTGSPAAPPASLQGEDYEEEEYQDSGSEEDDIGRCRPSLQLPWHVLTASHPPLQVTLEQHRGARVENTPP